MSEDESSLTIQSYNGNGESILIVDDVEEQRKIASGMLKELGYSESHHRQRICQNKRGGPCPGFRGSQVHKEAIHPAKGRGCC